MKANITIVFILVLLLIGAILYLQDDRRSEEVLPAVHTSQFFKEAGLVDSSLNNANNPDPIGLDGLFGGVVPHHIPTAIPILAEFYSKLSKEKNVDTFVILGPDHFERGRGDISISKAEFITPFGKLSPALGMINELEKTGLVVNDETPFTDHSIHSQLLFISRLFPDAKIVPIVFRSSGTNETAEVLGEKIASLATPGTFIVASVDFSHYLNKDQARPLDESSASMLAMLEPKLAGLAEADSPQSLVALVSAVKKMGADSNQPLGTFNSADYGQVEDYTTGYVIQFFGSKNINKAENKAGKMLFVGDIMLSRSVGELMAKSGDYNRSFRDISDLLNDADLAFGNLEGPISSRGTRVGSKYSFRADPRAIEGLKFAGFDVLSIANNHIWDYGRDAFLDTLKHIKDSGIEYVGGGNDFEEAHGGVIKDIKGIKVAFLAYTDLVSKQVSANETSAGVSFLELEQMKKDIRSAREKSDMVAVSFHWGDEYQTKHNKQQENIARIAIDAGAALVIGHHPHVRQEVEQYKDGWIAYSLGNFVFDQNFSEETMRGLVLEVTIDNGRISEVNKKEVSISRDYKPRISD